MPENRVPRSAVTEPSLLAWIGPPFFSAALRDQGWEVAHHDPPAGQLATAADILAMCNGRLPFAVILADKSSVPMLTGMQHLPCLTIFYAVDTHIHSWHPQYGQGFDACLISLRDDIPAFSGGRLPDDALWWSPPYAAEMMRPPAEPMAKTWPLLFAGTADPAINPERCAFLDEVQKLVPGLHREAGHFPDLFARAEVALNHCAAADLNFRVFEALGCGACLLTPDIGHGQKELFTDGEDLFMYALNDPRDAAQKALWILGRPEARLRVAEKGRQAVNAAHRPKHRAAALSAKLRDWRESGRAERCIAERLANTDIIMRRHLRLVYLLHADALEDSELKRQYLQAATDY